MDAIIDLTSRAVALITIIQETLVKIAASKPLSTVPFRVDQQVFKEFVDSEDDVLNSPIFIENGSRYVNINAEDSVSKGLQAMYCFKRCLDLINWIRDTNEFDVFNKRFECSSSIPAPDAWRESIREILYRQKSMRMQLANALQYLPMQIILATGAQHYDAHNQRLLQIWNFHPEVNDLNVVISKNDIESYKTLKDAIQKHVDEIANDKIFKSYSTFRKEPEKCLLEHEELLVKCLEKEEVPLSFQYIFDKELLEIAAARESRRKELFACQTANSITSSPHMSYQDSFEHAFARSLATWPDKALKERFNDSLASSKTIEHSYNLDAMKSASDMQLWGLALSGGGIRSATFSLGILQGLAKKGVLQNFDYLSTVSGGGYIGSWLVSWIARNQSVIKVSNRLNPEKSSDPMAEEVRPIRWLRMYSNFLAPSTGIMSTDSWTVGMTILRNMLINQIVIVAILLSLVSGVDLFYRLWSDPPTALSSTFERIGFFNIGILLLLTTALIAGWGMRSYFLIKDDLTFFGLKPIIHRASYLRFKYLDRLIKSKLSDPGNIKVETSSITKRKFYDPLRKKEVTDTLTFIACLSAFILSSWMYHNTWPGEFENMSGWFSGRLVLPTVVVFIALLVVYLLGRYYEDQNKNKQGFLHILIDMVGSAVAAFTGVYLFVLLTDHTHQMPYVRGSEEIFTRTPELGFTLLPPFVLEIFAITIVLRMALLGANFPDERREWWGRIGGRLHRVSLVWLFAIGVTYLGSKFINQLDIAGLQTTFAAGWGALLLTGLRSAYTFKTSGENTNASSSSKVLEILALLAPYIFVIGLLMLMPALLDIIKKALAAVVESNEILTGEAALKNILISIALTIILFLFTVLLGHRIGVNQFSLHFFYKNRLVRAFLGATRLRHDRLNSANPFTGFDQQDDLKISSLKNENGYFGPYFLINTTLNATNDTDLDRQDRQAESFIFSPEYCGFDFSRTRAAANRFKKSYDYAYRPTSSYAYPGGPTIGTAMAISGAAANPNQGYHSNAATAFLMTLFNIRLGWWIGNPRQKTWTRSDPRIGLPYTILNLIGKTDVKRDYVCLSDGGHFDNMGLYELIRRRCKYIVLCDGEQDGSFSCEGLANAVRRCRIDFGVEIAFKDFEKIIPNDRTKRSKWHQRVGKITYPEQGNGPGWLIYIKSTIQGDEPVDIREYAIKNDKFPHQSTADQFFDEAQFESYRKLGLHIAEGL